MDKINLGNMGKTMQKWTANEFAAKRRICKRPDQQKYTLSRHTEFCKAERTT